MLIAVSALVVVTVFFSPSDQPSAGPSLAAATVVECESIRHAHDVWEAGRANLDRLSRMGDATEFEAKALADQGKAFADAVSGNEDQPSRLLAVAIAQYNLDIVTLNTRLVLSDGGFDQQSYDSAVNSWRAVDQSYDGFQHVTCLR